MEREIWISRAEMGEPTDLWVVMDVYENDQITFEITGRSTDWGGIYAFGDELECGYRTDTIIGEGRVVSFIFDRNKCLLEREIDLDYVSTDLALMPELSWMTLASADRYRTEAEELFSVIDSEEWIAARRSLDRMRTWAQADTNLNAKSLMQGLLRDIERALPKDYLAPLAGALVLDTESLAGGTVVSSNFRIDGRDHDLATVATGSTAAHGIATTEAVRDYALAALPAGRLGNITGVDPAPDIAAEAPGLDLDSLIAVALAHSDLVTLGSQAPATLGTADAPVVAYAASRVDLPAGHRGYGVLVADQSVRFFEGAEWRGLVLVRGDQPELRMRQDGVLLGGAALTGGPADLRLLDNAAILRSLEALGLAQDALDSAP